MLTLSWTTHLLLGLQSRGWRNWEQRSLSSFSLNLVLQHTGWWWWRWRWWWWRRRVGWEGNEARKRSPNLWEITGFPSIIIMTIIIIIILINLLALCHIIIGNTKEKKSPVCDELTEKRIVSSEWEEDLRPASKGSRKQRKVVNLFR